MLFYGYEHRLQKQAHFSDFISKTKTDNENDKKKPSSKKPSHEKIS